MESSDVSSVCDPLGAGALEYHKFLSNGDGCLINREENRCYPVFLGVPVFLSKSFSRDFVDKYRRNLSELGVLEICEKAIGSSVDWSFSREWDEHFNTESDRTWGYTVEERFEQFLMETQVDEADLKAMTVLDAGCGNGSLTERIGRSSQMSVGIDFSSGVHQASARKKIKNMLLVQGDLLLPPLVADTFDLVISIGVLHHTPNTRLAFDAVSKLVKPGGKFYVWLYRRPENFAGRMIKVPIYDAMRWITSRLPPLMQDAIVHVYARLVRGLNQLLNAKAQIPLREYVVSAFDDLTCRWRSYHHPIEVARWFHENGFAAPVLSHWDNPYGFGLVAKKTLSKHTPGVSYGDGVKLWDNSQTLLGRLHRD